VLEIPRQLYLAEESLSAEGSATFTVKDLERNAAAMLYIFRGVNGRHATAAEHALDAIPLSEKSLWKGLGVGRGLGC
jgi:hypothetical protein